MQDMILRIQLERRMREQGFDMKRLSQAARCGDNYVNKIIRGIIKDPSVWKLTRIATALDCTVNDLIYANVKQPQDILLHLVQEGETRNPALMPLITELADASVNSILAAHDISAENTAYSALHRLAMGVVIEYLTGTALEESGLSRKSLMQTIQAIVTTIIRTQHAAPARKAPATDEITHNSSNSHVQKTNASARRL